MSTRLAIILPCPTTLDVAAPPPSASDGSEGSDVTNVSDSPLAPPALCWFLVAEGNIRASGCDSRWLSMHRAESIPLVALVAVADMALHWFSYPDLAPAQAAAVAQRSLVDSSLESADVLHVTSGYIDACDGVDTADSAKTSDLSTLPDVDSVDSVENADSPDSDHSFAKQTQRAMVAAGLVRHSAMEIWSQWLARYALQPQAMVPLALLVPPSAEGVSLRARVAGEDILCAGGVTAVSDPVLDSHRIGAGRVETIGRIDVDKDSAVDGGGAARETSETLQNPSESNVTDMAVRLVAIVSNPPLDLLAGRWRARRRLLSDSRMRRRLATGAGAAVLLALGFYLAPILGLALAALQAERQALAVAEEAGVSADSLAQAEAVLLQRLRTQPSGALSFSAMAAGVYPILAAHPSGAIDYLSYSAEGVLTLRFTAPRMRDIEALVTALRARGYGVEMQPIAGAGASAMVTIRAVSS